MENTNNNVHKYKKHTEAIIAFIAVCTVGLSIYNGAFGQSGGGTGGNRSGTTQTDVTLDPNVRNGTVRPNTSGGTGTSRSGTNTTTSQTNTRATNVRTAQAVSTEEELKALAGSKCLRPGTQDKIMGYSPIIPSNGLWGFSIQLNPEIKYCYAECIISAYDQTVKYNIVCGQSYDPNQQNNNNNNTNNNGWYNGPYKLGSTMYTNSVTDPNQGTGGYGYNTYGTAGSSGAIGSTLYTNTITDPTLNFNGGYNTYGMPTGNGAIGTTLYTNKVGDAGNATLSSPTPTNSVNAKNCQQFTKYHKFGDRGGDIPAIQMFLKERGFYNGKIDGVYGITTFKAVQKFQEAYQDQVLNPWEIKNSKGTGFFYKSTRATVNQQIGCPEPAVYLERVNKVIEYK